VIVFGLCILLLTVMVRGVMHPFSRKQAKMTMRMQALQPELQKLKEKYKDDRQQLGMAQMELYRKHGINPMGSCWIMLAQMPVFLGLYYCLQESIHFRLAPFIPGWIKSLTAPDMLIHWGDRIPWISTWNDYGWFLWLGPYFNLLPVIAVALMIMQQKLMMPPAADDQAAMQQKMMKYMMVFFGLMFYKVAAGLCLYFIASSAWGFAERKLLPKKKPGELPPPVANGRPSLMQRLIQRMQDAQQQQARPSTAAAPPPVPSGGKKKRGRPAPVQEDGLMAKLRAKWTDLLRKAEKR
jgi:YidC/Oxa1 family membrane protein insertase